MKRLLLIAATLSLAVAAWGQSGAVYFENLDLTVGVKTTYPTADAIEPFTVSLWYLPGATAVPSNLAPVYDSAHNLVAGGVYRLGEDGFVQVSPNWTESIGLFDPGFFDFQDDWNPVSFSTSGAASGVLAVVGWTGDYANVSEAVGQGSELGIVSFVNPLGTPGSPEELVGWETLGQDLMLIPYPFPEPSILALFGVGLISLLLRRATARQRRS